MSLTHGVTYKPGQIEQTAFDLDKLLETHSLVRIYWLDLLNVPRCRLLPTSYFKQLLSGSTNSSNSSRPGTHRPGVTFAKVGLGLIYLITPPGFSAIGEYVYVVDVGSLRPLGWTGSEGVKELGCFGWFKEKGKEGEEGEVGLCARSLLKRVVEDAEKSTKTSFLVGIETEFILLSSTSPPTPSNIHQWSSPNAFLSGSREYKVLTTIASAMASSGLSLQMVHSEAAPGQYEVVSGPLDPLSAADQVVWVRELIRNVASENGLHATFAPRPFMNSAGSAAHVHISVHSTTEEKKAKGLETYEESFLAGVLDHLPALPAITLPTPASYKRVSDGVWSGGTYVHYGTENRESPIRLTNPTSPHSRNFEMRFVDGTANPYLALAGIIGTGVSSIKERKKLTMKDCPGPRCAWEMEEGERRALGIVKRMPLSVSEARENLKKDEVLRAVLGEEMVEKFLSVSETLEKALMPENEDESGHLTRLVEFY